MQKSTAILKYSVVDVGHRLVGEIDQELADYYRALIPKWHYVQRQKYGAHVSIVRKETPVHLEHWGKHEGEEVEFIYDTEVKFGAVYCWLNVFCVRFEEIRLELGLPVSSQYTLPPDGFVKCFHSTLGNWKND